MELEIETREDKEREADSGSGSGPDLEMKRGDGSDEKVRCFWEEIMERDRKRRDTDRSMNDFMCIKSDSYGQMIYFQKRLLEEAGHVLVAVLMDPLGCKESHLRSSKWDAQRIAEALRCTFLSYDDLLSCFGSPDADADVRSRFESLDVDENVASCFGIPGVDEYAVFSVLVQMAASQLSLRHSAVIRAPLPHRARIDLLLDAANSTQAKLIVLELRKKKRANKELFSEYDLNDVPKLVLPEQDSFGYMEEDDHLDFILMATSMNHWHIGDGPESVLEGGGCRNDVKLRHFSHRHPLTLSSLPLPIQYYCDCCMEHITSDQQYYLCDHCDFSLHKSCGELPQCWDAPFHVHPLRLMILEHESDQETRIVAFLGRNRTEPRISCIVCEQGNEKGPVYRCWSCYAFFIHHQCAVPLMEDVRHECHAHPLRFHTSPEVKTFNCYGCGGQGQSVSYSCSECPSNFHLECARKLTLTPSVEHKRHWHPLVLTSAPPKDDSDEYYCEVCAQRRHGDHWIYHCEPCEYEAHPHCVNPDIPPYTMPEPKESSEKPRGESEDDSEVYEEPSEEENEDEEEASNEDGSSESDSDEESS